MTEPDGWVFQVNKTTYKGHVTLTTKPNEKERKIRVCELSRYRESLTKLFACLSYCLHSIFHLIDFWTYLFSYENYYYYFTMNYELFPLAYLVYVHWFEKRDDVIETFVTTNFQSRNLQLLEQ